MIGFSLIVRVFFVVRAASTAIYRRTENNAITQTTCVTPYRLAHDLISRRL